MIYYYTSEVKKRKQKQIQDQQISVCLPVMMQIILQSTAANKSLGGLEVVIYSYSSLTTTNSLNVGQHQNLDSSRFAAFYHIHSLWQPHKSNGQIFGQISSTHSLPASSLSPQARSYSLMFFIRIGQASRQTVFKCPWLLLH